MSILRVRTLEPPKRTCGEAGTFRQGPREVHVLESVDLALDAGDSLAIVGASGAGTSTLMHILDGLESLPNPVLNKPVDPSAIRKLAAAA